MSRYELSVLVPSRNEEFLKRTIDEVLTKRRGSTEVIAVLDGAWPVEPIPDHPDVTMIHHAVSIGQRAAQNEAARMSQAKFVMKLDAHCALDEGFDVKLMAECDYDWTVVPRLYNLHAFDWVCNSCSHRTYQGPQPTQCQGCGRSAVFSRDIVWQPRWSRKTDFMRFDKDLIFKYWGAYAERPEAQGDIADTMSLLGACFFMHRKRYWELDGADEGLGSWGQQGVEVACKAALSGGRLVVNKNTWYSHLFRTQPGFGFPYPQSQSAVDRARERSRSVWLNNTWKKQVRPLSWLLEKFAPIPSWHDEEGKEALEAVNRAGEEFYRAKGVHKPSAPAVHTKRSGSTGIVFYTENRCPEPIFSAVTAQLKRAAGDLRIVSVSLKPIEFGDNIVLNLERGHKAMYEQILAGLSELDTDFAFLCEHDVLYNESHFRFIPPRDDVYYYNIHTWKVNAETGRAVFYKTKQVSGLCANRELLVGHYRRRLAKMADNVRVLTERGEKVKNDGWSRHSGHEPGCHREPRGYDNFKAEEWMSEVPLIDIRHNSNFTVSRWRPEDFRDPNACLGWRESDHVPGWPGKTEGRFLEFLQDVILGRPALRVTDAYAHVSFADSRPTECTLDNNAHMSYRG